MTPELAASLGRQRDDRVEGVVLAALRGAGLHGLGGMRRRRRLAAGTPIVLLRPLLDFPRAALAPGAVAHREDETNRDLRYLRNRVRHVVLPALRGADPERFDRRIVRLARLARSTTRRLERGGDARGRVRRGSSVLHAVRL